MNKVTNSQTSSSNVDNGHLENTNPSWSYLHLLDEEYLKIRLENQYIGEIRLMQYYSRKNQTKYYTVPFEKELDNIIKSKSTKNKQETKTNILINNINRQQGYIRIIPPRN